VTKNIDAVRPVEKGSGPSRPSAPLPHSGAASNTGHSATGKLTPVAQYYEQNELEFTV
jgi:hypothetical protein